MSGDLEDFLRRAAQRRQAKAAQQQPACRNGSRLSILTEKPSVWRGFPRTRF